MEGVPQHDSRLGVLRTPKREWCWGIPLCPFLNPYSLEFWVENSLNCFSPLGPRARAKKCYLDGTFLARVHARAPKMCYLDGRARPRGPKGEKKT